MASIPDNLMAKVLSALPSFCLWWRGGWLVIYGIHFPIHLHHCQKNLRPGIAWGFSTTLSFRMKAIHIAIKKANKTKECCRKHRNETWPAQLVLFCHWIFQLLLRVAGVGKGAGVNTVSELYLVCTGLTCKPSLFLLSVAPEIFCPRKWGQLSLKQAVLELLSCPQNEGTHCHRGWVSDFTIHQDSSLNFCVIIHVILPLYPSFRFSSVLSWNFTSA